MERIDTLRTILAMILTGSDPELATPELFDGPHRQIFDAILALHRSSRTVSYPTVFRELQARHAGLPAETQGAAWRDELTTLPNYVCAPANLPGYLEAARADYRARMLRNTARLLAEVCESNPDPETVRQSASEISALSEPESRRMRSAASILAEIFLAGPLPRVPLGLSELSELAIAPGDVCVVGARTGIGKTALLATFTAAAIRAGWHPMFLTLEMPGSQIMARLLSVHSGIPLRDVLDNVGDGLGAAGSELTRNPITMVERLDPNGREITYDLTRLRSDVRAFSRKTQDVQPVVIIDYLQLIRPSGRYQNRHEQVGEVARGLKEIALAHRVPIIVAAQLSRAVEQRSSGVPVLSDLRESGEIEQIADQIVLVHREGEKAILHVAKYRNGRQFKADAYFDGRCCRFLDPLGDA